MILGKILEFAPHPEARQHRLVLLFFLRLMGSEDLTLRACVGSASAQGGIRRLP